MIEYKNLKKLAELRLAEAKALHAAGFYDGAVYLCGYVVELSLKARICKNLNIQKYPDSGEHKKLFASHNPTELLLMSGLFNGMTIDTKSKKRRKLFANWSELTKWDKDSLQGWDPSIRYMPAGTYTRADSEKRLRALETPTVGFFSWIQKVW